MIGADWPWFAVALAVEAASMVAFGVMRQRTLSAAGSGIRLRDAVAVSYGAGAIHMTAPMGSVPATAYAFRELRRRGADSAAAAWSLAVTGVMCTVTLVALGAAGLAAGAVGGTWGKLIPAAVGGIGVAAVSLVVVKHLAWFEPIIERLMHAANRLLRRQRESGIAAMHSGLADLAAIRPRRVDTGLAVSAAAVNWLLDLACLWACAHAMGIGIAPWVLVAGYALAMLGSGVSPLPGGLGVVDGVLVVTLVATGGVSVAVALGAVIAYRVISLGSLVTIGWGVIGRTALRTHREHRAARRLGADLGLRVAAPEHASAGR